MPSREDIDNRFTYHPPSADQITVYGEIRDRARDFAHYLNATLPESREKALSLTKLEEAVMHANSCIARNS